jgi:hypothetical protein
VLAALVGVHAVPHADVGAVYLVDDAFGAVFEVLGLHVGFDPVIDALYMLFDYFVL